MIRVIDVVFYVGIVFCYWFVWFDVDVDFRCGLFGVVWLVECG